MNKTGRKFMRPVFVLWAIRYVSTINFDLSGAALEG